MKNCTLVLLFNSLNQVLLCKKKRGFGKGKWNGAGGKIENGESTKVGALRELNEETGIKIKPNSIRSRGILYFYFDKNPQINQAVHLFTGEFDGSFKETEEMKPQWWNIESIPYEQMWEDDKIWLPRILKGEHHIEYNFYLSENGNINSYKKII